MSRGRCSCARCVGTNGRPARAKGTDSGAGDIKDSVGNPLADGDTVTVVKTVKVKGVAVVSSRSAPR